YWRGASDMLCLETEPVEDVDSAFEQLSSGHIKGKISQDVEVELKPSELNSELEVMEAQTWMMILVMRHLAMVLKYLSSKIQLNS
ncbi:hypothetical protein ZWY2020_020480, partial [Hordeum vulgare]